MHFCIGVITEDKPAMEEIEQFMNPFSCDNYSPFIVTPFMWDWYVIGGRWCDLLNVSENAKDTLKGSDFDRSGISGAYIRNIKNFKDIPPYLLFDLVNDEEPEFEHILNHYDEYKDYYYTIIDVHG